MALINEIIWIEENVDMEEYKKFIESIRNEFEIRFVTFKDVESGFQYIIKTLRFKVFLLIISGKYFSSYINELNKHINVLTSIPISIIFTWNRTRFLEDCDCKEK